MLRKTNVNVQRNYKLHFEFDIESANFLIIHLKSNVHVNKILLLKSNIIARKNYNYISTSFRIRYRISEFNYNTFKN